MTYTFDLFSSFLSIVYMPHMATLYFLFFFLLLQCGYFIVLCFFFFHCVLCCFSFFFFFSFGFSNVYPRGTEFIVLLKTRLLTLTYYLSRTSPIQ
ncbi:hypothetical protein BGW37DRAFT_506363 [Umbelopsis sp. PMI_123]|nr:hypothetical protein BGW37DRAFT_506363 [Umbelopsis sp. PMI_123]